MKKVLICATILINLIASSCEKVVETNDSLPADISKSPPAPDDNGYTLYSILTGQHEASPRPFKSVSITEMKFNVLFDSSAIYKSALSDNQRDTHKLFGFSDNNANHQSYSARFGWRFYNNRLELMAYVYNKGVRSISVVGPVAIGVNQLCSIKVRNGSYLFYVK